MKNLNLAEFAGGVGHPNHEHSFRALSADDCAELCGFYRDLGFEARRGRFGAALSDQALADHCRRIDWRRAIMIACVSDERFAAVLEIHQVGAGWQHCEIVLACRLGAEGTIIVAQLLQLAAFAAGKLGCRAFVVPLDRSGRAMFPFLEGMGATRLDGDQAVIELGDYGGPRRRPAAA
jgi:hypothetical protein